VFVLRSVSLLMCCTCDVSYGLCCLQYIFVRSFVRCPKNENTRAKKKNEPVFVFGEAVVEHPVDLVNPESNELVGFGHSLRRNQQDAAHDARKVAQVEDVVALARRRQEVADRFFVNLHCRFHHRLRNNKIDDDDDDDKNYATT